MSDPRKLLERLIRNTHEPASDHGCWVWNKGTNRRGYGRVNIWVDGKTRAYRAHRVSFALYTRPEGVPWHEHEATLPELAHYCDNPPCINPDHLEPSTRRANLDQRNRRQGWGVYAL